MRQMQSTYEERAELQRRTNPRDCRPSEWFGYDERMFSATAFYFRPRALCMSHPSMPS